MNCMYLYYARFDELCDITVNFIITLWYNFGI